ncbi:hypothetical protein Y032_1153g3701 [Ancylostoma ceylanicum]|nr:hypothetical protein Y032_1153g3701 [Ancylostoma ceylanicum]
MMDMRKLLFSRIARLAPKIQRTIAKCHNLVSRKRVGKEKAEMVLHELADDLKNQDRGDEWDAIGSDALYPQSKNTNFFAILKTTNLVQRSSDGFLSFHILCGEPRQSRLIYRTSVS